MIELGITIEENVHSDETKSSSEEQDNPEVNLNEEEQDNAKADDESIESIPFIAEPSREKRSR